jgi:hypothetical protein
MEVSMTLWRVVCLAALVCGLVPSLVRAEDKPPVEADYYKITTFEVPKDVVLEASAFQLMPNGQLAVASRRGEIWMV